ncbi:MAG: bifunctional adenosylcobinamide kinase/adenosylcobinamide-phosphate guanylyltransferase [Christensenellales bacterium]|jgi:adenosylcobinamide kinase/adenosylcobinamide-phosphate guanylyltransferase
MGKLIFITGGAKSGKSMFAHNLAAQYDDVAVINTGEANDKAESQFAVYDAHSGLGAIIMFNRRSFFIIDSVTAMVAGLMRDTGSWEAPELNQAEAATKLVDEQIDAIIAAACASDTVVAVVTNECGMGMEPPDAGEKMFRELLGRANGKLTQFADEAYFMISGLTMKLK